MSKQQIDDDDLSRLLEIAHRLSIEEGKKMTLEQIKATAEEMGMSISPEKIDKAFWVLQQEKNEVKIKKEMHQRRTVAAGLLAALLLIGGVYWYVVKRIPPFEGTTHITMTSKVIQGKASDILKEYRLFEHSQINLLIEIEDIDKRNRIHYAIYDATKQLFVKKAVDNETKDRDIFVVLPLFLPIGTPLGEWQIEVWVDDKKVKTMPFQVTWGSMEITLTDDIDDKSYKKAPLRKLENFKKSEHTYAICHSYWSLLDKNRGGNSLVMKWIRPDGTQEQEHKIAISPTSAKSYYWAKAGITLKSVPVGSWKVELWYADSKITERSFTVEN
jgi:hypothetical protein